MTASLHHIPLPQSTVDEETLTWDQSIADIPISSFDQDDLIPTCNRTTLTFYAVAHGKSVVGTSPSLPQNQDTITWQTKFDQDVVALSSNHDGSVIACSTKSHVSLLKGCDGSILATRQVAGDKIRFSSPSPGVVFVSRPKNVDVHDALVVFRPGEGDGMSDIILISNIDGSTLNSDDLSMVKEAVQDMSIEALALPSMPVSSISGIFVNKETIRFFVATGGKLGVYDWHLNEMKCALVVEDLLELMQGEWRINDAVDMHIDDNRNSGTHLAVSAYADSEKESICWFNVLTLSLTAQYLCELKISSFIPIRSCNPDKCVAAAFSTKGKAPKIHIVQSLIKVSGNASKDSDSMMLFIIDSQSQTVELAAPSSREEKESYAFRFLSKSNDDAEAACVEFVSGNQERAGIIHHMLANQLFDDAYTCINEYDENPANDNISSLVHKSLIPLWQFRHVLSKGNISSKGNMIEAQECLRRLASSAISGGAQGVKALVDATDFLMRWPKNQFLHDATDFETISVPEMCMVLSAMSTTITSVIEVLSESKVVMLIELKHKLDERQVALRSLRSITDIDRLQFTPDDPYLNMPSLVDLIHLLVSQGAFKSVETLMKSQWKKKLSPIIVASSVLLIPVKIDPKCFLPWLCDMIIPSLSIGHPMLESIRAWSCCAADKYDEDNISSGLDNAIMLLKAVSKATSHLTAATNTSVGHHMLKEAVVDELEMPETPKHNGSFSFGSKTSLKANYNRPTVLNIGMISGMKTKGGKVFSAKRAERPLIASVTSHISPALAVDEELEYDCVENKLHEATRLKTARDLGLRREYLTLKDYESKGEQYIVKELVKAELNNVISLKEGDCKYSIDNIRSFARDLNAEFDEAVHQYAIELCDSSRCNIPSILGQTEMLSQWCSAPAIRCLIVLRMLRKALASIQRPPDLSKLASDALNCVTDGNVKSELEEALRLLSIDSLVRKYCGNGAQTFFRLNEASHCRRLVEYVGRHIDVDGVISDLLTLCNAFNTSVSRCDACVTYIERVIFASPILNNGQEINRTEHVAKIVQELFSRDHELAEQVCERIVAFCSGVTEESRRLILQDLDSTAAKRRARLVSSTACSILSIMRASASHRRHNATTRLDVSIVLKEFQKLCSLQNGYDVYLSFIELQDSSSCISIIVELLKPCVNLLQQSSLKLDDCSLKEELKANIASAKHCCAILSDSPSQASDFWSRSVGRVASYMAKTTENHTSLLLLDVSGVMDERTIHSFHSIMSVALTLHGRASVKATNLSNEMSLNPTEEKTLSASLVAMKSIAQSSLLLRDHLVLLCPPCVLASSILMANMTEFMCDVSVRFDLGIGERLEKYINLLYSGSRKYRHRLKPSLRKTDDNMRLPIAPVLHPSWYIGDGLLLPPLETMTLNMLWCQALLDVESNYKSSLVTNISRKSSDIIHALEARGAHSLSLRLVSFSISVALSRNITCDSYSRHIETISASLGERSLGGIESGITSGNIDHILSIAFLIGSLSKEKAFNIYQSALPSAIGQRDFDRILTLASIGLYCVTGKFSSGETFPWSKQTKFMDQCCGFVINSKMWSVLSRYEIPFDPSIFTQPEDSSSLLQGYCKKLVWSVATQYDCKYALRLGSRFAKYYNLNKYLPVSLLVEFLLSPPENELNSGKVDVGDIRLDMKRIELDIREICFPNLSVINQSKVLRKCVMSLEQSVQCSTDYDRHALVLTLYKECLDRLGAFMTSETRRKAHAQEKEYIERRLSVIAVLSSIFDDRYPPLMKPNYTKLFEPLSSDPSQLFTPNKRHFHVIGYDLSENIFDPLNALHNVLSQDATNAILASLATLCNLLGLPSGYIHARALVIRFQKAKQLREILPPPESTVFIVAKKLSRADDRAELAWWCSSQYNNSTLEKLKCLNLAHTNATLASEQIESNGVGFSPEEERYAIARVKQIDLEKSMLTDQIIVNNAPSGNPSTPDMVKTVYKNIALKVQQMMQSGDEYMPERLVKELLVEGSMAAAQASLDMNSPFTTTHFRSLAILIHDVCRQISTRYSHINTGKCARIITRRWLVHGDEINGSVADAREAPNDEYVNLSCNETSGAKELSCIDEDNTREFVMDIGKMNIGSGEHAWAHNSFPQNKESGIKSSVEPPLVGPILTQRELSDNNHNRVALRIAFLMCFAQDYHKREDEERSDEDPDENDDTNINKATSKKNKKSRLKLQKASLQKTNSYEGNLALAHAKELLGIVFANTSSTVESAFAFIMNDSRDDSFSLLEEEKQMKSKALSFAMRYRALKVAHILCPHDVLVRVMLEEGHASDFDADHLDKIAFGSFLAMEIEAMGLTLPHSNLSQLSTMHYPSYARTLWRNHGGISVSKRGGRLHLLLMELSVNHHETVDWDLLLLMITELTRDELSRSLLLACEWVVQSKIIDMAASCDQKNTLLGICGAAKTILETMSKQVLASIESTPLDTSTCSSIVDRLLFIINKLSTADSIHFIETFATLAEQCKELECEELYNLMSSAACRLANHLTDSQSYSKVPYAMKSLLCDDHVVSQGSVSDSSRIESCIRAYEESFTCDQNLD